MNDYREEFAWALVLVATAAVIALSVSLFMGVFALIFGLLAWWAWDKSEAALLALIFIAPLLPMFKVTQTIGVVTLAKDIIIVALFFKYVAWPFWLQTLPYRRVVVFWPLLALGISLIIGLLMADNLVLGVLRVRELGLYVLAFFAVLYMPASRQIVRTRLAWFFASAAGVLVLGVYQWFFALDSMVLRFDPLRRIWIPRISSTLGHPTVFGEYLSLMAAFLAAASISLKGKWRWRALAWLLLTLPFVYATYSRAVWLGFGVALVGVLYVLLAGRASVLRSYLSFKTLVAMVAGLGVVGYFLVTLTAVGTFLSTALDPDYASNRERLEFAARLLGTTSNAEVFFGRGLGDVIGNVVESPETSVSDIAGGASRNIQLTKDSTLVDNQFLKTFIELGLAGVAIYVWLYWRMLAASWRITGEFPLLGSAAFGFFLAFMVQALFVDIWDVFPTNLIFWILAAHVLLAQQANRLLIKQ